jgi:hypothetical protein
MADVFLLQIKFPEAGTRYHVSGSGKGGGIGSGNRGPEGVFWQALTSSCSEATFPGFFGSNAL